MWCFFGGEGGAAVLGLMPSPDPVKIGEHDYVGLLVPSAPVPFGGALIYVPADWVKPADGGVERLMNVYVSMGVTPPISMLALGDARTGASLKPAREAGRGRRLAALVAALFSFEFSKCAYLIGNAWNGCTPGAFIARQSSTIGQGGTS